MARIFWSTLRRHWRSTVLFGIGISFFHWLVVVSFPAIGGLDAVQNVVQTFPTGLRTLLRIAPNLQAGFGLIEYLALSWFHPFFLGFGSAFVVQRATNAIASQIENGAVYLIFSRPISRQTFLLGNALELLFSTGLLCLLGWIGLRLGVEFLPDAAIAERLPFGRYALIALIAWLLFAALGSGALIISSLCSRKASADGIGATWAIGAFLIDLVPFVADSPIGWLNPWHHYFPQEIVLSGTIAPESIGVLIGWIVAGIVISGLIFARRDLI